MRVMLKFCYLLGLFLLISCGNATKKESESTVSGTEGQSATEESSETDADSGVILFFGDSLTAGMGLEPDEAFPAVIQEIIDSLQLNYKVINAGLSGETTAAGKNRLSWLLTQQVDVFVLELGANDGLRGIPLTETRGNLQAIIEAVRKENAETEIILAGMQIPPNMGPEYTSEFRSIFPDLAEKNDLHLIPFLLKDVGGIAELNQEDGIHPTAEGQRILAQNVWQVLENVITENGD
ncbi:arylesterase [Poritiphilus flavus]|uniref:Arylesterase n=1 Tax=Poritiphilus flavus TaxID=2697053 RepID=A0A6L9EED2_9FLAO|nr:arylesterase [Poritiphilus flavus]NAS13076.1 arylesterase [Poritiphilus flavus]